MGSSVSEMLKGLVREPLVHFVLIGAVLFYIGGQRTSEGGIERNEIVITEGDIAQMLVSWQVQGLPPPSAAAIRGMVEAKVREEVLYREAITMGLDQDDIIVKRRLAQKMDFLAEDLSALQEPTTAELLAWFKSHSEDFAHPPRISFRHVYYSFDTHGKDARAAAVREVATIAGPGNGDRFMFQNSYAERTEAELLTVFGPAFAREVFTLEPGHWSGPLESGYGWHAVFVENMTPSSIPVFKEVEDEVKAAFLGARRAEFQQEAYRVMREKYDVVLPKFGQPESAPDTTVRKQSGGEAS
ncbi:peptidylprolyl isomerase [Mesorhizobium sp. ZC-5]|uniref:peptidylprolyl isomerase n=1 Tax=Mesorhizobium sp. ZC-5 TaxID=2986066 RepID=UPI0021E952FA|nr:peptidylprolyl isomerase [Mesorhizobium sp. ZC-5]MCV3241729.1 peptidylprolyl isomerase [Mesorhizobium sp. ZC-5]